MNIKLTDKEKIKVNDPDDLFAIMQRILLRDNKIDQDKEHFWIVGMNVAGLILYIELVSLGGIKSTVVEPMKVFRVAVMKNASRVIAVHNHPGGTMAASANDKELTDRLIQVGKILDIRLDDHLIISPTSYISFRALGLMDELEKSLKYVPTYQVVEQIREEEKAIAKEALKVEKEHRKKLEQQLASAVYFLVDKAIPNEQIAEILGVTLKEVEKILKKKV